MTTTVLVPVDASDRDQRAVPAAVEFTDVVGGDVHLVRAFDTPLGTLPPRRRATGVSDAACDIRRSETERSLQPIVPPGTEGSSDVPVLLVVPRPQP